MGDCMSTEALSPTCSRWLKAPMRTLSPIVQFLMTVGPSMLTHLASKQTVSPHRSKYDLMDCQQNKLCIGNIHWQGKDNGKSLS